MRGLAALLFYNGLLTENFPELASKVFEPLSRRNRIVSDSKLYFGRVAASLGHNKPTQLF